MQEHRYERTDPAGAMGQSKGGEVMGEIHLTVKGMAEILLERAGIDSFMEMKLDEIGYFGQPASRGHHLAEYGGLVKQGRENHPQKLRHPCHL